MTVTEITNAVHGCRETELCWVKIPAELSHTGKARWDQKPVDKCLAGTVNALNAAGEYTAACCCGHGKSPGSIILHDGTVIETLWCHRTGADRANDPGGGGSV